LLFRILHSAPLLVCLREMGEIASTPEQEEELAAEIASSVEFIAQHSGGGATKLERDNPERACEIVALLCRGLPVRVIIGQTGCNAQTVARLRRDHGDVITKTKYYRSVQASRLQLKAADALEKKLEDVLADEEVRGKTSVKDLAMGFGICTDKKRLIDGEGTVVTHEHKVTLEDARKAIEEAKKEVSEQVIDV